MSIVYLDGQFVPREKAYIHIDDRGFLFGDGVFTTIKLNNGRLESFHAHIERLHSNALALNIQAPFVEITWLEELARLNQAGEGAWRIKIVLTGGKTDLRSLQSRTHGHLLISMEKCKKTSFEPCKLTLFPYPVTYPTAKLKSLSYLNRLFIADYASQQNCDEALVLSREGWIMEAAFANIFWRVGDVFFTPDPELPFLSGVSLLSVAKCAKNLGMKWHACKFKSHEIAHNAQLFLTNAITGIVPVKSFHGRQLMRDLDFESRLIKCYGNIILAESISIWHE